MRYFSYSPVSPSPWYIEGYDGHIGGGVFSLFMCFVSGARSMIHDPESARRLSSICFSVHELNLGGN